ncbi:DUF4169 family protein [Altererythrobacter lauratis]|uniref:DUF4169 family protein n=1 Tax=Alteraurantiacibacter lauratis TaxID=2054627 RepID=A0ABV7EEM6_9SPHN
MAEVVNLRLARKAKARADKARIADGNRAAYGEGKAAKAARQADAKRAAALLDSAKRERD